MVAGEKTLPPRIDTPIPIAVDIFHLSNNPIPWKSKFVARSIGREMRPQRLGTQADASIWRSTLR